MAASMPDPSNKKNRIGLYFHSEWTKKETKLTLRNQNLYQMILIVSHFPFLFFLFPSYEFENFIIITGFIFLFFSEQNQVKFHWEIHTYITIHNGRQILGVCTSFSTLIETCKTKLKWIKKNQNSFFSLSSFVSFRRKKNNKPSRSSSFFSSISLCCCYSMLNKE